MMIALPALLRAQTFAPTPSHVVGTAIVSVRRATSVVRIDGRLDEAAWGNAPIIPLPFETYPGNNVAAAVRTDCRVAFDAANLYVGCYAFDAAPRDIRAVRADRDAITEHDRVGITIDPFNDRRRGWQFAVNPLGVQFDAVYDAASDASDAAWNAIWTSAARIVDDGYVIEASIPFKSLRFPAGSDAQSWGFIAWRYRPRDSNVALHSVRLDPAVRCVLCQAGALTGVEATTPSRNIELGPTLTSIRTDRRLTPDAPMMHGNIRPELGLDARWSVTPGITVNITANPDFSQVEADAAQLDANQRFALSYPERRPFFLDGADLFASPQTIVFTRTVADPVAGMKLTAKEGLNAIGLLGTRDRVTNLLIPGRDGSAQTQLAAPSTTLLGRLRRDVMGSSTVGLLGTVRESGAYANHVVGIDALLRPHPTTSVTAQALLSATRYPDSVAIAMDQQRGTFTGSVVGLQARYQTRGGNLEALAWNYTNGFRADAGFIPQVGVLEVEIDGDRVFWGKSGGWLTRLAIGAGWFPTRYDATPSFTNAWRFVRLAYEGPAGLQYSTYARMRTETYRGVRYDFWTPWMMLRAQPWPGLTASIDATFGGEIDYQAERLARTVRLGPSATVRVTREAEIRVRHSAVRLRAGDQSLLRASVSELRAEYHPTSRTFARALLQHHASHRSAASVPLVVPSQARGLASQLLLSYRVDAQTAALVGYGDAREAPDAARGTHAEGSLSDDLRPMARSFFVKLSYAWRP
jgi:hypothetical protein